MLTGYRVVPNGDIFVKVYDYSCDRCNCYLDESWPREDEGDKDYCGECAFITGMINEDEYKKRYCFWIGVPFRAYIDDGEVKLVLGKKTPRDRLNQNNRNYPEYKEWRRLVFERDQYTCQKCGQVGGTLNAHHIKSFKYYPKLRTELNNGITLCKECHILEHRK